MTKLFKAKNKDEIINSFLEINSINKTDWDELNNQLNKVVIKKWFNFLYIFGIILGVSLFITLIIIGANFNDESQNMLRIFIEKPFSLFEKLGNTFYLLTLVASAIMITAFSVIQFIKCPIFDELENNQND